MILLIRVRAENSVALNFPTPTIWMGETPCDARGSMILSWILQLDKRASCMSVYVSGFTRHKLHSVGPAAT